MPALLAKGRRVAMPPTHARRGSMPPLFQGYVAVDWSAAAHPGQGANSIWIATLLQGGQAQFANPGTRHEAMEYIQELLVQANGRGHRLLCGFDFPFGYPVGTARMLNVPNGWQGVWEMIGQVTQDDLGGNLNQNNRFHAAAGLNRGFQGEGPFWGLPNGWEIHDLPRNRPRQGFGRNLPPERRYCEKVVPGASTVWQLYGRAGTVGSQALMGIARLQELRQRNDVHVWPFETLGEGGNHVLAEIYPSLIQDFIQEMPGNEVLDRNQVHAVAVRLRDMDAEEHLQQRLAAPGNMLAPVQAAMLNEEALFLDITLAGNIYAVYLG